MSGNQLQPSNITNLAPNFILSKTDPGDETQKRFRYQHTYTALIAIQMFAKNISFKELLCEHHEDILGVNLDGSFVGIQVKTKQISDGAFELDNNAVYKSIVRFIKLDKEFPNQFKKFVFVSNCPVRNDKSGKSLTNLIDEAKKKLSNISKKLSPTTLNSYIKRLCQETLCSEVDVLKVLSKVETQQGPSMDDIESKIITEHLGTLPECSQTKIPELKIILDMLIGKIYFASSKRIKNPIKDYIALTNGSVKLVEDEEINTKRITGESISKIITEGINKDLFLKARNNLPELLLSQKSSTLMKKKMNYGLIDNDSIELMDDLRSSAEDYFFEKYYKDGNPPLVKKELDQVRIIVHNQAQEAKSRSKAVTSNYGLNMLHNIEDRLAKISEDRSKDVYHCPYEILKGLVGILTNECMIAFSEVPEGGWKDETISS